MQAGGIQPGLRAERIVLGSLFPVAYPDSESRSTGVPEDAVLRGFPAARCRRRQTGIPGTGAVAVGVQILPAAMGILEKISEIEKEIARTQKNKGEGWVDRAFFSDRLSFPVCKMGEWFKHCSWSGFQGCGEVPGQGQARAGLNIPV